MSLRKLVLSGVAAIALALAPATPAFASAPSRSIDCGANGIGTISGTNCTLHDGQTCALVGTATSCDITVDGFGRGFGFGGRLGGGFGYGGNGLGLGGLYNGYPLLQGLGLPGLYQGNTLVLNNGLGLNLCANGGLGWGSVQQYLTPQYLNGSWLNLNQGAYSQLLQASCGTSVVQVPVPVPVQVPVPVVAPIAQQPTVAPAPVVVPTVDPAPVHHKVLEPRYTGGDACGDNPQLDPSAGSGVVSSVPSKAPCTGDGSLAVSSI